MNNPEETEKYQVKNQQPVQGQVVGNSPTVYNIYHPPVQHAPLSGLPQRIKNRWVVFSRIALSLLLVGSLLFLFLHTILPGGPSSGQPTAPSTHPVLPTPNATATIQAQNSDLYPPITGKLVLYDPLRDNSRGYNWTEDSDNIGACTFTGSAYQVSSLVSPYYHGCAARTTQFSDFAYEVGITIVQGDCGAIVFRADLALRHYYYFRICQDGTYQLLLYTDNGLPQKTFASVSTPAIHAGRGQFNVIAAVANSNTITVYVNHQVITTMTDNTYTEGQIGVFADNDTHPTVVLFTDAKVWVF